MATILPFLFFFLEMGLAISSSSWAGNIFAAHSLSLPRYPATLFYKAELQRVRALLPAVLQAISNSLYQCCPVPAE